MRQQLIQYVDLLFAGAADCEDIKQEILQNTLDRYDDLIAQGKAPEAAYRLAISGIGDINAILGQTKDIPSGPVPGKRPMPEDTPRKKVFRAVAVALYILCMVPLIICSDFGLDTLGLCGTLAMVAVATVLMMLGGKESPSKSDVKTPDEQPENALRGSVGTLIWTVGLAAYFLTSFLLGAWHITWLIFPITAAVRQLVIAILELKEAK